MQKMFYEILLYYILDFKKIQRYFIFQGIIRSKNHILKCFPPETLFRIFQEHQNWPELN